MTLPPLTRSNLGKLPPDIIKQIEAESGVSIDNAIFEPEEGDYLPAEEAARRFRANPASIGFNLMELHRVFDISEEDIGSELGSKRLIANCYRSPDKPGSIALVHGDDLMAWVNNSDVPKRIRKKLKRVASGEGAFFARRIKCVGLLTAPCAS